MKHFLLFALIFVLSVPVLGQDAPNVGYSGRKIVSVSNALGKVAGMECAASKTYTGIVKKIDFEEDEITISSFILADAKNKRHPINLNNDQIGLIGRNAVSIIASIIKTGGKIRVSTYECSGGGSGVFIYADKIALIK